MQLLTKDAYFTTLLSDIAHWVTVLARPVPPPRMVLVGDDSFRLEFQDTKPETVMIGKLVRAVSGVKAAMHLAEIGFVTECGCILRVVGDLCEEIMTISAALDAVRNGATMPTDVAMFVDQYFFPVPQTPEALDVELGPRYVTREKLIRAKGRLLEAQGQSADCLRQLRFVNKMLDGYVHGYQESSMELWCPITRSFQLDGSSNADVRAEFVDFVIHQLHAVVCCIECTAAATACEQVFLLARDARRRMDSLGVSKAPSP